MDTFDESFESLYGKAYSVAFRMLGDRSEAEDVAQEALGRAYARWFRVAPYAEAWVARVASNLSIDVARRHSRRAARISQHPPDSFSDERLDLQEGLRHLSKRQREVVCLRYLADLSEAEVSKVLGCAVGTVKSHAHRGLEQLRLHMTRGSHYIEGL